MAERRFFVAERCARGKSFAVYHTQADGALPPSALPRIIYKHEIPERFWWLSLDDYIAFFERGIKPKITGRTTR